MDGHLAALEMRESDYDARIVFVSSRQRMTTARNAAYSAGAVAVLETPLTQSVFDENWDSMMGEIPPAPGLADLDELYPESDEPELPPLPMPPIMPAMPEAVVMPDIQPEVPEPIKKPKKKGKWLKRILVLLILAGSGAVIAHYFDMIDLTEYLPMLEEYLPKSSELILTLRPTAFTRPTPEVASLRKPLQRPPDHRTCEYQFNHLHNHCIRTATFWDYSTIRRMQGISLTQHTLLPQRD